jgi:hypothetical protein
MLAGDAALSAPAGAIASSGEAEAEPKSEHASTKLEPAAAIKRRDLRIWSLLSK